MDTTEQLHFHFSLSCIGEGNGNPLQCSCLENPRDGGASWAAVYGVAQSWTRLKRLSSSSSLSLLQGIFPTQGLNPGLPHCRRNLYQLGHQGSHLCFVCPSKLWGRKAPSRWSAPPPSLRNTLGSGFLYLQRGSLGQLSPKPRPPVGKVGVAWAGRALGLWRGPPAGRQ